LFLGSAKNHTPRKKGGKIALKQVKILSFMNFVLLPLFKGKAGWGFLAEEKRP
jgi:hypothetical protein